MKFLWETSQANWHLLGSGGYQKQQRRSEYPSRLRPSRRCESEETVSNKASGDFRLGQHGDKSSCYFFYFFYFFHHPIIKAERSAERNGKNSKTLALVLLGQYRRCLRLLHSDSRLIKCCCIWALKRQKDRQREREREKKKKFGSKRAFEFKMRTVGAKLED